MDVHSDHAPASAQRMGFECSDSRMFPPVQSRASMRPKTNGAKGCTWQACQKRAAPAAAFDEALTGFNAAKFGLPEPSETGATLAEVATIALWRSKRIALVLEGISPNPLIDRGLEVVLWPLSPLAQVVPPSGTPRDFTKPQTYTVTAQNGSSQAYTVIMAKSDEPNAFTWGKAEAGNWIDASNWTNNLASGSPPIASGRGDYVLTFNQPGKNDLTHDLADGFLLNQLTLEKKDKGNFNLTGKSLTFAKSPATQVKCNNRSEQRLSLVIP